MASSIERPKLSSVCDAKSAAFHHPCNDGIINCQTMPIWQFISLSFGCYRAKYSPKNPSGVVVEIIHFFCSHALHFSTSYLAIYFSHSSTHFAWCHFNTECHMPFSILFFWLALASKKKKLHGEI